MVRERTKISNRARKLDDTTVSRHSARPRKPMVTKLVARAVSSDRITQRG